MAETAWDAIVIGAGVSGLAALGDLDRAGLRACCIEARDRVGGRILTVHDPLAPVPVELGAEFIHGRPPELWDWLHRAGVAAWETGGRMVSTPDAERGDSDAVMQALQQMDESRDESFASFLDRSNYSEEEKRSAAAFVEGFNAAHKEKIGVASLAQDARAAAEIDGDCSFRVLGGYDSVALGLARSVPDYAGKLRLNSIVEAVEWKRGAASVNVRSALHGGPETLQAARVLVTVPLGVIGAIRFSPEPRETLEAARALEFGQAVRVTFWFDRPFWEDDPRFAGAGFILSEEAVFPTWWTCLPASAPVITGWSAGPNADPLLGLDRQAVISQALSVLGKIAGRKLARLRQAYFHDWHADPFARGAYSYVPPGAMPARRKLAEPVEDTLYFAGEATDLEGHSATVHGAIASGRRAARQILGSAGAAI